jgi:hypothetical protein
MFYVGEWPLENIIYFLDVLKNDFDEVDEAMLQGDERPCEVFFLLSVHRKKRLGISRLIDVLSR